MPQIKGRAENLMELLTTQVGVKQQEIDALLDITRAINDNRSEQQLLQIYDLTLLVHLRVKNIAIFLHDETWNLAFERKITEAARAIDVEKELSPYTDVVRFDEDGLERPEALAEFDVVLPVRHKDQALAYVLMGYPHKESYEVMDEKIRFIQAFTNIAVVAIENKKLFKRQLEQEGMKKELQLASQVQSMLIPDHLPDDDRIQMAAVYQPHRNVGGDYYDFIELSNNEVVFCIADISGKGTGAALLMANFQAHVRALMKTSGQDLKAFVRQLNENILVITRGEKFITMFLGRYNYSTRQLVYVNCGHNPSMLYHGGETLLLTEGCTILGMFDQLPSVKTGSIQVPPGSVIINYTDGVTDVQNEKGLSYSTDHIIHYLQRHPDTDMHQLVRGIMNEIYRFKGEMEYVDDISILTMRIK
ncbi:MAG: SpoIIE family protein phosphatase [Bacteroidetes bacterium]|nr:SpoIIE family protein phosphatase [Bacteroidota bacterium]